jgi:soluble lytic murein transglycosylase
MRGSCIAPDLLSPYIKESSIEAVQDLARFSFHVPTVVFSGARSALWTAALLAGLAATTLAATAQPVSAKKKHAAVHSTSSTAKRRGKTATKSTRTHGHVRHVKSRHAPKTAKSIAKSRKLQHAFLASTQLRPMAQQLANNRTPAAYAGVLSFAHAHPGDAAAAAYLALGHAYLLDRNYPAAISNLTQANAQGESLDDYADYLTAQAQIESNQLAQAETMLRGFAAKHPDSIFVGELPVTIANLSIQQGDPQTALTELNAHASEQIASHVDYLLALARAQQLAGNTDAAAKTFRHIYLGFPLSSEAAQAKLQLQTLGAQAPLTVAERRARADALYAAQRFGEAGEEYRMLANDPAADTDLKQSLNVAAAACDYKLKRGTIAQVEALPDTANEAGARRLYLLMELARDRGDVEVQQSSVTQLEQRFPTSQWLAEALYSSGNMYMLRKDYQPAITYYLELAKRFPSICKGAAGDPCSNYAPSAHWRASWLTYRLGDLSKAAVLFDEQIADYPGGKEIPSALYWRARIYQDDEKSPEKAAAYYEKLSNTYLHYYYAQLAVDRLKELHGVTAIDMPQLNGIHREEIPALTDDVPEDDVHVVRAKLLANAGLNEYITPEIRAAEGSEEWGSFAEAEIYASYGENFKAMHVMKKAISFYASAAIDELPLAYWHILFPQPYWSTIEAESAKNGLDPYMVASLIRQESEFNPGAISNKDAYGLMQLIASAGRQMAKQSGLRGFSTSELLDPNINIRLGTLYLRETIDKFGGHPEYAFAAYNAGDNRVTDWQSMGNYKGIDEFVESIPFTETRDYVQAIIRNEMIYRDLNRPANAHPAVAAVAAAKAGAP